MVVIEQIASNQQMIHCQLGEACQRPVS